MSDDDVRSRELITGFLANSAARCPVCRYALRGCTSDKCPECGATLTLEISIVRPSTGWWMAGVIGLSLSMAMTLLLLIGLGERVVAEMQNPGLRPMVAGGFASDNDLARWSAIVPLTMALVVLTLALCALASRREAFGRLANPKRAWVGLIAAASPLIMLAFVALLATRG